LAIEYTACYRVEFVNQFETVEDKKKNNKKDLKHGASFEPVSVYNVLEEFLTCLLNKLHEEIGALLRHGKSSPGTLRRDVFYTFSLSLVSLQIIQL